MNIRTTITTTLLLVASSSVADSFMLLDNTGSVRPVQLTNIGPDGIEIIDSEDGFTTIPHGECIAFLRPAPHPLKINQPTIVLHDGQSFPGTMVDGPDPDHLRWQHDWIGELNIPVDRVDRIILGGMEPGGMISTDTDMDVVRLLNGDVVEGFVLDLTPVLRIETDSDTGNRTLEIQHDRIGEIDLFGRKAGPSDPMVWTNDGTIAHFSEIAITPDGHLGFGDHMYAPESSLDREPGPHLSMIHTISYTGSTIHPIGSLPIESIRGPVSRLIIQSPHVTDPSAPFGLSPVELHGPVSVRYTLPEGTLRFRTTVRMPNYAMKWGDCGMTILVDGEEVHRCTFNSRHSEHPIDIEVSGDVLEITLDEGANGPVQDHIRFEYGMLLPLIPSTP